MCVLRWDVSLLDQDTRICTSTRRWKVWYEKFKPVHPKASPVVELEEAQEGDVVTLCGDQMMATFFYFSDFFRLFPKP